MNIFCSKKKMKVISILHLFFTVKMSHFLPTIMPQQLWCFEMAYVTHT